MIGGRNLWEASLKVGDNEWRCGEREWGLQVKWVALWIVEVEASSVRIQFLAGSPCGLVSSLLVSFTVS